MRQILESMSSMFLALFLTLFFALFMSEILNSEIMEAGYLQAPETRAVIGYCKMTWSLIGWHVICLWESQVDTLNVENRGSQ